jgi:hypothetical protein
MSKISSTNIWAQYQLVTPNDGTSAIAERMHELMSERARRQEHTLWQWLERPHNNCGCSIEDSINWAFGEPRVLRSPIDWASTKEIRQKALKIRMNKLHKISVALSMGVL